MDVLSLNSSRDSAPKGLLATPVACSSIDIIVPVYGNAGLTIRCLDSLAQNIGELAGYDPRLIVINDSPLEQEVRAALASFARGQHHVTILENERNLGFIGTANRGLEIACRGGRDAILVNADTETFSGTLENLVKVAHADPQIGFVSPRSNNASFCSLPHMDDDVVMDPAQAHRRWARLSRTMPAFHFTPTAVGFYLYIKGRVLANLGFLDPDFGVGYEEENDLIFRANKLGYRAALANHAFAFHAGSASFKLLDLDLRVHRSSNMEKAAARHAEYLPLMRRYEESAHFRAETLLGSTLPCVSQRVKLLFDLSSIGPSVDGTSEMSVAIVTAFIARHSTRFDISVICKQDAFAFHGLDKCVGLKRYEVDQLDTECFALGIRLGQPFNFRSVSTIEDRCAVNIYAMLDTIAEDCGYLSVTHRLEPLWSHVTRYANGLVFISKFSEQTLATRYPDARALPNYTRLLPTSLRSYEKRTCEAAAEHVLVVGNHFAHKASDSTAEFLAKTFPSTAFVVVGRRNHVAGNLRSYRSGTLSEDRMESLYARASVVVLPSYVEGFGLALMHSLAAGKVVVARDIPVTREILATYERYSGVFLFAHDGDLADTLQSALHERRSHIECEGAYGWGEWVDGLSEFCTTLLEKDDLFERLVRRIQSGSLLRKADLLDSLHAPTPMPVVRATEPSVTPDGRPLLRDDRGRAWQPAERVTELLELDGEEFVCTAYVTLLNRLPDSDGLVNYLVELKSGVGKLEIVSRLKNSSEGRKARMPLAGYEASVMKNRVRKLVGLRSL